MFKLGVKFYVSQSDSRIQIWEQDDSLLSQWPIARNNVLGLNIISHNRPELRPGTLFVRGRAEYADWEISNSGIWRRSVKSCETYMSLIDEVNDNDGKIWMREV